jgi:hypothetical protein
LTAAADIESQASNGRNPIAGNQQLSAKDRNLLGAVIGRLQEKPEPARAKSFMRQMPRNYLLEHHGKVRHSTACEPRRGTVWLEPNEISGTLAVFLQMGGACHGKAGRHRNNRGSTRF